MSEPEESEETSTLDPTPYASALDLPLPAPAVVVERLVGLNVSGRMYHIEEQIGRGGSAWVYRATESSFGETVAIKVLFQHLAEREEVKQRFLQEARIQHTLAHPNIVKMLDVVENDKMVGLVLEWIDGVDLRRYLKAHPGPYSTAWIWRSMSPLLDAISMAHERGIIHRDIKPGNILLSKEEGLMQPKIADFGIAKVLRDSALSHTRTGIHIGTTKYSSPEQLGDSKRVDARSDIYSLGLLLCELATGHFPFPTDAASLIRHHLHTPVPPLEGLYPDLSVPMARVIERCLQKAPEARFASVRALADALRQASGAALSQQEIRPFARALRAYVLSRWQASESRASVFPGGTMSADKGHRWTLDDGTTMTLAVDASLQMMLVLRLPDQSLVNLDLTPLPKSDPMRPRLHDILWLAEALEALKEEQREALQRDGHLSLPLCGGLEATWLIEPDRWRFSFV